LCDSLLTTRRPSLPITNACAPENSSGDSSWASSLQVGELARRAGLGAVAAAERLVMALSLAPSKCPLSQRGCRGGATGVGAGRPPSTTGGVSSSSRRISRGRGGARVVRVTAGAKYKRSDVEVERQIGEGSFGIVYKGVLLKTRNAGGVGPGRCWVRHVIERHLNQELRVPGACRWRGELL
jgi:hypothetical protein